MSERELVDLNLVEQATQEIKNMIIAGRYDEEGYLPSEGEMSALFGVSRATVREAVRSMEVRGFVQRIHGKGVKVVDNGVNSLAQSLSDLMVMGGCSLKDIIEVRHIIETSAAKRAAFRATGADIEQMRRAVEEMEAAGQMDEAYIQSDFAFHMAMICASGNPVLVAIFEAYTPLLTDTIKAASQGEEVIERKYHFHRDILEAVVAHDRVRAGEAIKRHLSATEENVHVQVLEKEE